MPFRGVFNHFVPDEVCEELAYHHRSIGVVGYRSYLRSTTLFDLSTAEPRLLPTLIQARQLVWDCVEDYFDKQCQVFVEHTSLISWHSGASIGWHHDANRDYLSQRHYSAVLYLNTQGEDFTGGTFCFRDGPPPLRVSPAAGTLLVYTADERNVHQVEEVTAGERLTLTMWFTLDAAFQEDKKVLSQLVATGLEVPGLPETMYLSGKGPTDIRVQQLKNLGIKWVEASSEAELQQSKQQQRTNMPQAPHQVQQFVTLKSFGTGDAGGCNNVAGTYHAGTVAVGFSSLQQAILTVNMVLWRLCAHRQQLHTAPLTDVHSRIQDTQQVPCQSSDCSEKLCSRMFVGPAVQAADTNLQSGTAEAQAVCSGWSCTTCCCNKDKVTEALQLVESYLLAGEQVFKQSLRKWRELGVLVGGT